MRALLIAGALAALAHAVPAHAQQQNPLPPGDGHDIVAVACTQCHGPNAFAQLREGPQAWRFMVHDMILRGAQVRPSEVDRVVNYLATNFGLGVNVPPPVIAVSLPDGAGKDLVETRCGTLCHGLDRVAAARRAPAEWDAIMRQMIFLGAPVSGDDVKTITSYLNERFGKK